MMGKKDNPLRDILNYASKTYLEKELDLWYILTVVSPCVDNPNQMCVRGLFIGRDIQCYSAACDLSLQVNFNLLEAPVKRMVVYLDEEEFHSTWLGNKSIYRTRMAMEDGGMIIIIAPGVSRFGEDSVVDQLIRKYGYSGTPAVMKAMDDNQELRDNLSAVAHLIHGSSEGRFQVTYCPGHLSRSEIEQVGFEYGDLEEMRLRYDIATLKDGWNEDPDGQFYFIRNPALGLWATEARLSDA
jgi:nickel-dependent lactate racemase